MIKHTSKNEHFPKASHEKKINKTKGFPKQIFSLKFRVFLVKKESNNTIYDENNTIQSLSTKIHNLYSLKNHRKFINSGDQKIRVLSLLKLIWLASQFLEFFRMAFEFLAKLCKLILVKEYLFRNQQALLQYYQKAVTIQAQIKIIHQFCWFFSFVNHEIWSQVRGNYE
jgi:hypothetical protein